MSRHRLEKLIRRSMDDEEFLDRLLVTPERALSDFKLTDEEFQVISSGDEVRFNEILGRGRNTTSAQCQLYHHSQHKGIAGQKPDLLPRVVSE